MCVLAAGALIGHPVEGVRVALTDGAAHAVDSSELAFKLACQYAFRDAYSKASPTVLEPIMAVEVSCLTSIVALCRMMSIPMPVFVAAPSTELQITCCRHGNTTPVLNLCKI